MADAPPEREAVPQGERTGSQASVKRGSVEPDGNTQGGINQESPACCGRKCAMRRKEMGSGVAFLPSSLRMDGERRRVLQRRRHQQGEGCRDAME